LWRKHRVRRYSWLAAAKAGITSRSRSPPAEVAQIPVTADAALSCAVHDILQSPDAVRNIMSKLRPGAWVAAGEIGRHARIGTAQIE